MSWRRASRSRLLSDPIKDFNKRLRKIITGEAAFVGGLFHFKPSVQCRYWHETALPTNVRCGGQN